MQLLRQILVDVTAFCIGHLDYCVALRVENLDFFFAEVQLLASLRNLLLDFN